MAYSEFGRRVAANSNQGTDHGTAGSVDVYATLLTDVLCADPQPILGPGRSILSLITTDQGLSNRARHLGR
ncbi:MAG: hypothetical protein ACRDRO_28270 [Pseudonocardiaceae bacterium]